MTNRANRANRRLSAIKKAVARAQLTRDRLEIQTIERVMAAMKPRATRRVAPKRSRRARARSTR